MELARGRKFITYSKLMDAALEQKTADILPWVKPGVIVDAGFGTGQLLYLLAKIFPKCEFVGIDLSNHYLEQANKFFAKVSNVRIKLGDAKDKHMISGTVATKIYSTVMHEVYSYNDYDLSKVEESLKNTYDELKLGGRVIIRDGVKPKPGKTKIRILNDKDLATFYKFAEEFKHGRGIDYVVSGDVIELDRQDLYEFLSKKEYQENWDIEINEEFGYLTLSAYKKLLKRLGYKIIGAREYQNPWILKNWWEGKIEIIGERFPATNCLIVADK